MAARRTSPDFIESLARGLETIRCFGSDYRSLSLSEVAAATGLARPTVRRILLTLQDLGYVRTEDGRFALTCKTLELGMAYVGSLGLWQVAWPHLKALVERTGESSSMAELDGSDIVYVARVAVPKLIGLRVEIGTRFPSLLTSQGKVLLASLSPDDLVAVLSVPSRSVVRSSAPPSSDQVHAMLEEVRVRGWATADEELAPGVRSIAVPVSDAQGRVRAAMNVTVHAAETPMKTLVRKYLPWLKEAADGVATDWRLWQGRPQAEIIDLEES